MTMIALSLSVGLITMLSLALRDITDSFSSAENKLHAGLRITYNYVWQDLIESMTCSRVAHCL
jgi:hypothetical protein